MTQGFTSNPNSTAFLASNPAPIRTFGFDVFVQEVIAAIKIEPSLISKSVFETFEIEKSFLFVNSAKLSLNFVEALFY